MELKMENTINEIILNYNKINTDDKIINYTDKDIHLLRKAFECCNTIKYRCLLCNSFNDILSIIDSTINEYNNKSIYKIINYRIFKPLNKIELCFNTNDGQLKLFIQNFISNKVINKEDTLILNSNNLEIELRQNVINMINNLRKELYIKYFNSSNHNLFSVHRKLKTKKYKEFRKDYLIEFNKLINYINSSLSHSYLSVRVNKGTIPGTWSLETHFIDNL